MSETIIDTTEDFDNFWKFPQKCAECDHKPHSWFTEGDMISVIHGNRKALCECCIIKKQIAHIETVSKNLETLKADLKKACNDIT